MPGEERDAPATCWEVRRGGVIDGEYGSAAGRRFKVGDTVNMPPPVPSGSVWRVVAVEESELKGYDGILVLEPARAVGNRA